MDKRKKALYRNDRWQMQIKSRNNLFWIKLILDKSKLNYKSYLSLENYMNKSKNHQVGNLVVG